MRNTCVQPAIAPATSDLGRLMMINSKRRWRRVHGMRKQTTPNSLPFIYIWTILSYLLFYIIKSCALGMILQRNSLKPCIFFLTEVKGGGCFLRTEILLHRVIFLRILEGLYQVINDVSVNVLVLSFPSQVAFMCFSSTAWLFLKQIEKFTHQENND